MLLKTTGGVDYSNLANAWVSAPGQEEAAVAIMSAAAWICSLVVWRPRVSRMVPAATSRGAPMASRVADGVTWPEWQADPVEAARLGQAARMSDRSFLGWRW